MNPDHAAMHCRKCLYLRIIAAVCWSVGLVSLSLLPDMDAPLLFRGQDKVLHFCSYLLLAWLTCRVLQIYSSGRGKKLLMTLTYCLVLGALLELAQGLFIPGRTAEWLDVLANAAGAASGCALFCLWPLPSSRRDDKP